MAESRLTTVLLAALQDSGKCVYARYCGPGCVGGHPNATLKINYYDAPLDPLDQGCFWHDRCYRRANATACDKCLCNENLVAIADPVSGPVCTHTTACCSGTALGACLAVRC